MSVRLLSLLLVLALAAGCKLTLPPAQPVDYGRYGRWMGQYEAERIVKAYFRRNFFSANQVQYQLDKIRIGSRFDPIAQEWHYGYLLPAKAKYKGLIGGTGEISYVFVLRNGRIVYVYKRYL